MPQRFPSPLFLASNILMFLMPCKALAETCGADNSVFNMPILLVVALIRATVGGLVARQRKGELQRLNEQLLQINAALRKQAKIELYAPSLSYACFYHRSFIAKTRKSTETLLNTIPWFCRSLKEKEKTLEATIPCILF